MQNLHLVLYLFFCFLIACQPEEIKNLKFDDALYAKNLIGITGDFPKQAEKLEFAWYISSSPEEEWEKLSGIETDKIVLLTGYVGKYLKCTASYRVNGESFMASVVSSEPVIYKGNQNTDWFKDAGFGIMVHYLQPLMAPNGGAVEWNKAVNSFDVKKFAEQVHEAKVGFVLFTLGQNSGYYCAPNAVFDSIVGVSPGELCSTRDLPRDLIGALDKYNIPVLLYLPSNPPMNNQLVSKNLHYAYKKDSATSQFNQPILENMIREWSLRYGDGVKGWWFDGLYSWNNIRDTRMDMSLKHNISTHTLAAKAGNRHSIVTYNYGLGKIAVNTPYCDYSSGEKRTIDEYPAGRWVEDGVQWFLFTYLGEQWAGKGQQFETDSLVAKAETVFTNDGVLCLEVVTNRTGEILPHHLKQINAVGERLSEIKQTEK
jgi:hypothetical protein